MRFNTNPFPGMNPWLEQAWGDVHASFMTYARDSLQDQLPPDLLARVEEYLSVADGEIDHLNDGSRRLISPDVAVTERTPSPGDDDSAPDALYVSEEPIRVLRVRPPQTLRRLLILDSRAGQRVITVIELLSPANKQSPAGRRQYLKKQSELLAAGVNLVEIDLLRGGGWVMATELDLYPESLRQPYRVGVVRAENVAEAELYPATYARPLPTIRVPLRSTDQDARLPLQWLINHVYERGRYGNDLDYARPPEPPLSEVDRLWIEPFLRELAKT